MNILFFLTPKSEVAYIPANESLRQAFEKLKLSYKMYQMLHQALKYHFQSMRKGRNDF